MSFLLNVVMLSFENKPCAVSVIMLNVIMLNDVVLNVVAPKELLFYSSPISLSKA